MTLHTLMNIVVIDDVCRLALYTWRHLSRSIGFGIGGVPDGDLIENPYFWDESGPRCLCDLTHEAAIWWIDTMPTQRSSENSEAPYRKPSVKEQINLVLEKVGRSSQVDSSFTFLVDVRSTGDYKAVDALNHLSSRGADLLTQVRLVSSYVSGYHFFEMENGSHLSLPIYSKSAETFHVIWREIHPRFERKKVGNGSRDRRICRSTKVETGGARNDFHILVTGAGFEFRDRGVLDSGLGEVECIHLGMPGTERLLFDTLTEYAKCADDEDLDLAPAFMSASEGSAGSEISKSEDGGSSRFPVPRVYANREDGANLRKFAGWNGLDHKSLDQYWNELLDLELQREGNKAQKSRREYQIREIFRRCFLDYDHSFVRQALDAARFQWGAWLTTNYTRFADRAIDLTQAAGPNPTKIGEPVEGDGGDLPEAWRAVSTSNEAARLLREILHEMGLGSKERLLFKLHGDIGHLTTMAIAGHDKDLYSPLSLPIDSLHSVYTAAEIYLLREARKMKGSEPDEGGRDGDECDGGVEPRSFVWHVVGHSLADPVLVRLIQRVCDVYRHHHFFLVGPYVESRREVDNLKKYMLGHDDVVGRMEKEGRIELIRMSADKYLARLRRWKDVLFASELTDWKKILED